MNQKKNLKKITDDSITSLEETCNFLMDYEQNYGGELSKTDIETMQNFALRLNSMAAIMNCTAVERAIQKKN